MTKKQLIQALTILDDESKVYAVFNGKYSSRYDAFVTGVEIKFKGDFPEAIIVLNEVSEEELRKAA